MIILNHLTYKLDIIEFTVGIIFKDDLFKVTAFPLAHGIPSYGFRIEEADKLGELNVEALKNAGIKLGPIYKQIKSQESTNLDDGSIINGEDEIGKLKKGKMM